MTESKEQLPVREIVFRERDLLQFQRLSGDANPLHMDEHYARKSAYGRQVVFGALGALTALRALEDERALAEMQLEFRKPLFLGWSYQLHRFDLAPDKIRLEIRDGDLVLLVLGLSYAAAPVAAPPAPKQAATATLRERAAVWQPADFARPHTFAGHWRRGGKLRGVAPLAADTLMLASYLIGMECPGETALFSSMRVHFNCASYSGDPTLAYTFRTGDFEPHFGQLGGELELCLGESRLAQARITSFVRPRLDAVGAVAPLLGSPLSGKTALVVGGSRGLGASLVATLAASGCTVWLNYRASAAEAQAVARASAGKVQLLPGDAADPRFWAVANLPEHLDLVVLNACAPPLSLPHDGSGQKRAAKYIEENLALAHVPLTALLPRLQAAAGCVIAISSVYAVEDSTAFPHYAELKRRLEAQIQALVAERPSLRALIARPPVLRTQMSSAPGTEALALDPGIAAGILAAQFQAHQTAGAVHIVDAFTTPAPASARLVLGGSFTLEPMLPALQFWQRTCAWPLDFEVAPYHQEFPLLLDPAGPFGGRSDGLNLIALRYEDWLREFDQPAAFDANHERFERICREFIDALRHHAGKTRTPLLLLLCPSAPAFEQNDAWAQAFGQQTARLAALAEQLPQLHFLEAATRHLAYGVLATPYDPVSDELGHIPYPTPYYHVLGTLVARAYHGLVNPPLKVVVADCDQTLWQGVCGEVGPQGVALGAQHLALQDALLAGQRNGLLLALCSKNAEDDVWPVFNEKQGMRLRREHLVGQRINWQPKSENLAELAQELNLGLDSFLFLDDNPVEIAEVRHHRPEVMALTWPTEASRALHLLDHLWVLDRPHVTAEDRARTQLYQADAQRRGLESQTGDFASFIDSLGLQVSIEPATESQWERVAQLTQRTNQFNTTSQRRTAAQLADLLAAGSEVVAVHVADRFGSYGLVGLLILVREDSALAVASLALSCRVLGRGVEHRMLAYAAQRALAAGLERVSIHFAASTKNQPAKVFLENLGSLALDASGQARLQLAASDLAQLVWRPNAQAPLQEERSQAPTAQGNARARERLAERIVALGHIDALTEAIAPRTSSEPIAGQSIATWVRDLFGALLDLDPEQLDDQAPLDRYVQDSFKRVELTVALKKAYPALPTTFLYEQRTLAEISAALGRQDRAQPAAGPARNRQRGSGDIAVIGMAGRFPGAPDHHALWRLLREGREAFAEVPPDRWDVDRFFSESLTPGKTYCRRGGFMERVDHFDAAFFHISPKEAELMDPQQRLLLEVTWNLLEDAATTPERLSRKTGVFVGVNAGDYGMMAYVAALGGASAYRHADYYQLANRISYFFDLKGQSLTLDTACSSSGTAIFLACESIRTGHCEAAIAAGINLFLHPSRFVQYAHMRMISPGGRCMPFGAGADGTLFGEGAGAILLKPLEAALAHGDPIHGVIRACAVNSGGKTNGFTVPNPRAQADLVLQALEEADIDPTSISYVEAHGTGTPLGDPIEVRGLSLAYAERLALLDRSWQPGFCAIGSLKANIGHLEAAAAMPSIIKVLLQMRHRTLVPSLNAAETNPKIDFAESPFRVQQALLPWQPTELPRRAGISTFGAGGANAHLILEEPPRPNQASCPDRPQLFVLSGHEPEGLIERVRALRRFLDEAPDLPSCTELALTLQTARVAMDHRLTLVASNHDQLRAGLDAALELRKHGALQQGRAGEGRATLDAMLEGPEGQAYLDTLYAGRNLAKLATLWLAGFELDWTRLHGGPVPRRVHLPHYSFRGERFWLPEDLARLAEAGASRLHPLLDEVEARLSLDHGLTFSKRLGPSDRLLQQHRVNGIPTLPGVAYLAMVQAAAELIGPDEPLSLQRVTWTAPFAPSETVKLMLTLARDQQSLNFRFTSQGLDGSLQHCQGRLVARGLPTAGEPPREIARRCGKRLERGVIYARFRAMGIDYQPYFQGLEALALGKDEVLGELCLPAGYVGELETLSPHPSLADASLQAAIFLYRDSGSAALPFAAGQVDCYRRPGPRVWVHAVRHGQECSVRVCDEGGELCLAFHNFSFREGRDPHQDFYYLPRWEVQLPEPAEPFTPRQVLVVHAGDEGGLAEALLAQHRGAGASQWRLDKEGAGWPDFAQPEALAQALRELAPDCIYFLGGLTTSPPALNDLAAQRAHHRRGVLALFRLIRQLQTHSKPRLILVTANSWRAPAGTALPQGAAQHALVATLAKESSRLELIAVDLALEDLAADPYRLARWIAAERPNQGQVVLWRGGNRLVAVVERSYLERAESTPWRKAGSYLILGGLGGIGRTLARHLATVHGARLCLVGRRPFDQEAERECELLRRMGGEAFYQAADATDPAQLEAAVDAAVARYGTLHGAVHSAIVLADRTLAKMDEETFAAAYEPKFIGGLALCAALRDRTLDFVLFLSSINSFTTPAGQGNYSAGCLFKDALAEALDRAGTRARSVNWGYWGTVGIVANDHYRQRVMAQGFLSIAPELGMEALERLLASDHVRVAAVKGDAQLMRTLGVRAESRFVVQEGDDLLTPTLAALKLPEPDRVHAAALAQGLTNLERFCGALALGALQQLGLFRKKSERREQATLARDLGIVDEYRQLFDAVLDLLLRAQLLRGNGEHLALGPAAEDSAVRFYIADPDRASAQLVREFPQVAERLPLLRACMGSFAELLTGKRQHMGVLFPGGSLHLVENIYKTNPTTDWFNRTVTALIAAAAGALSRERPLRVLEVGAGTGGTSAWVLPALADLGRPVTYTYTDISQRFLNHGQTAYGHHPFLDFRIFDMEKEPEDQGFEPASFDLVFGTNCIHATRRMDQTLGRLKRLLRRGGLLIVNELVTRLDYNTVTFGLTSGWWSFRDRDTRIPFSPLLRSDQWQGLFDVLGLRDAKVIAFPDSCAAALGQVVIVAASDGGTSLRRQETVEPKLQQEPNLPAPLLDPIATIPVEPTQRLPSEPVTISGAGLRDRALELLRGVFATVLRIQRERIEEKATFDRLGIDSLISLEIVENLEKLFGELSDVLLFEYDTLGKLADYLNDQHTAKLREVLGTPVASPPARPSVLLPNAPLEAAAPMALPPSSALHVPSSPLAPQPNPPLASGHGPAPSPDEPIAVIGMAGRYAGSPDIDSLWTNLVEGRDCIGPIPAERWQPAADHPANRWGGFIDRVDQFEATFFNIPPSEAAMVDPAERLLLETAWTALEDACLTPDRLASWQTSYGSIGVYAGCMYQHYPLLAGDPAEAGRLANNSFWSIANRISFFFDFKGPSMAADTACSSGLSAIHLAVAGLREGSCAMALAGAVNLSLIADKYINLARLGMLGSGPQSRSLGAGDGLVPAEGVGAVLLKPLSAALRDRDPIWGLVRATAVNHGGRTSGFTVPNPSAHAEVASRALARAGVPIESINYLEVAANGSALGDPIEISGLARAFRGLGARTGSVAIGAVKSNLGHAEAASGIAQLIKVMLQLRHRWIAPSLHAEPLNPSLKLDDTPFQVAVRGAVWAPALAGEPRRASINSYGAGGSNAHIVVEDAPVRPTAVAAGTQGTALFVLSAKSEESLRAYAAKLADFLASERGRALPFADIVHSYRLGRQAMSWRLAILAADHASLADQLLGFSRELPHLDQVYSGRVGGRSEQDSEDTGYFASLLASGKLAKAARLWVGGLDPDWATFGDAASLLNDLPTYPFAGTRFWVEGRATVVDRPAARPAPAPVALRARRAPAGDSTQQRAQLFQFAIEQIAEILGLDPGEIDREMEMSELGLDSIHLTELAQRIGARHGVDIGVDVFFGYAGLGACLNALWRELAPALASLSSEPVDELEAECPPEPIAAGPERRDKGGALPIAVVGMSGRLPGSADLDAFWENLLAGRELAVPVPSSRWQWAVDEPGARSHVAALLADVDQFDPFFFGISPSEAALMDPQQRLLLEVSWQAIENAGYAARDLAGSRTGVFISACNHDYAKLMRDQGARLEAHSATGTMVMPILANRLSYLLDLNGPSEIIDTACSSSLVALHRAIRAIRAGECEQALVGAVNLLLHPEGFTMLDKAGILSSDGRVRLFHADATGYVRGEGVVVAVLKPLERAMADRDHIWGVLRGSATNHDGKSYSMTAPNPVAQEAVVRAALRDSGLDPASIAYIEAQGTGSPIGDPVEARALHKAYSGGMDESGKSAPRRSQAVGYLKPCTGHLESTYGLAALVKVLLAMRHGLIPGTPLVNRAAAEAALGDSPLYVATETKPWPQPQDGSGTRLPRRAAIHGFGFGGVNAHLLVEEFIR